MIDFEIQENLIIFKDSIVSIYKLEPIDVFLLSTDQYQLFETNIRRFLNSLKMEQIQLVMRSRRTEIEDLRKHFKNLKLQKSLKPIQEMLINDYILELSELINKSVIPFKEYLIIFRIKIRNKSMISRIEDIKKLESFIQNTTSHLNQMNINTKQLVNDNRELEKVIKSFLRI